MMKALWNSPLFGVVLSVFAYQAGLWANRKTGSPLCNPLLIAVALIVAALKIFDIPLAAYQQGGQIIGLMLAPATAALALSMYRQIRQLRRHLLPVVAGCLAGSCASVASVFVLCRLFRVDERLTASLLPKSVTTPIAMELSAQAGGIPAVTVAAVIFTGILGAVLAPLLIKLFHVQDPVCRGVAIGTCSHAIGTTKALEMGELEGAMSGVSIGVAGVFTVLVFLFF